jgi:hypothetical protein
MLKTNNKEVNKVIASSIIMTFYNKKLLTDSEFFAISRELNIDSKSVDIITLKSDICNKED